MLKCQPHGINDKILVGFSGDRLSCNALDGCTARDGGELSLIPLGALKCAYRRHCGCVHNEKRLGPS